MTEPAMNRRECRPDLLALFAKRIEGDDSLLELARLRFQQAGLGAEMHSPTPEHLEQALGFRPAPEAPVIVHLARDLNLAEPESRRRIAEFASRFAGRISGLVLHDHAGLKFGSLICYEIVFPDLVRRFAKKGADFLVTITNDGSFIYKQIGPIDRQRLIGMLAKDETTSDYRVIAGDRSYRVLLASVTYFKGEVGDEVVILVPKDKTSRWSAVENIIKAGAHPITDEPSVSPAVDDLAQA